MRSKLSKPVHFFQKMLELYVCNKQRFCCGGILYEFIGRKIYFTIENILFIVEMQVFGI